MLRYLTCSSSSPIWLSIKVYLLRPFLHFVQQKFLWWILTELLPCEFLNETLRFNFEHILFFFQQNHITQRMHTLKFVNMASQGWLRITNIVKIYVVLLIVQNLLLHKIFHNRTNFQGLKFSRQFLIKHLCIPKAIFLILWIPFLSHFHINKIEITSDNKNSLKGI